MPTLCDIGKTELARYVSGFPDGSGRGSSVTYEWLRPVFRKLWEVFDDYIQVTDELPWIYTERSLVGHLTAAAFLADYVAIEEFQQPKKEGREGRSDWWMGTKDNPAREIYAEAKFTPISSGAGWELLNSTMKKAMVQLGEYDLPEQDGLCKRLAMCFVQPYFPADEPPKIAEHYERWCGGESECPDGVDYYTCYWLNSPKVRAVVPWRDAKREGEVCCPGLFIYCRELR